MKQSTPALTAKTTSKTVIKYSCYLRKSPEAGTGRQQEGKFIELPHAEMGKVVVRFPPEASGSVPY